MKQFHSKTRHISQSRGLVPHLVICTLSFVISAPQAAVSAPLGHCCVARKNMRTTSVSACISMTVSSTSRPGMMRRICGEFAASFVGGFAANFHYSVRFFERWRVPPTARRRARAVFVARRTSLARKTRATITPHGAPDSPTFVTTAWPAQTAAVIAADSLQITAHLCCVITAIRAA